MIKIENVNNLKGAERFGECNSCGSNEDLAKVTFLSDDNTQQHSFKICHKCADDMVSKLKW